MELPGKCISVWCLCIAGSQALRRAWKPKRSWESLRLFLVQTISESRTTQWVLARKTCRHQWPCLCSEELGDFHGEQWFDRLVLFIFRWTKVLQRGSNCQKRQRLLNGAHLRDSYLSRCCNDVAIPTLAREPRSIIFLVKHAGPIAANWMSVTGDPYSAQRIADLGLLQNCAFYVNRGAHCCTEKSTVQIVVSNFQKRVHPFRVSNNYISALEGHTTRSFLPRPFELSVFVRVNFQSTALTVNICCEKETYPWDFDAHDLVVSHATALSRTKQFFEAPVSCFQTWECVHRSHWIRNDQRCNCAHRLHCDGHTAQEQTGSKRHCWLHRYLQKWRTHPKVTCTRNLWTRGTCFLGCDNSSCVFFWGVFFRWIPHADNGGSRCPFSYCWHKSASSDTLVSHQCAARKHSQRNRAAFIQRSKATKQRTAHLLLPSVQAQQWTTSEHRRHGRIHFRLRQVKSFAEQ